MLGRARARVAQLPPGLADQMEAALVAELGDVDRQALDQATVSGGAWWVLDTISSLERLADDDVARPPVPLTTAMDGLQCILMAVRSVSDLNTTATTIIDLYSAHGIPAGADEQSLLDAMNSVCLGSNPFSSVRICWGSVESSTRITGEPAGEPSDCASTSGPRLEPPMPSSTISRNFSARIS